jgi:hypothetical protein
MSYYIENISKYIKNPVEMYVQCDEEPSKNIKLMQKIEKLLKPVLTLENFTEQTGHDEDFLHWYSLHGIPVAYLHDNYPAAYVGDEFVGEIFKMKNPVEPCLYGLSNTLKLEDNLIKTTCFIPNKFRITTPFHDGKLTNKTPSNIGGFFIKETDNESLTNCKWEVKETRNFVNFKEEYASSIINYNVIATRNININEELIVLKKNRL